MYICSYYHHLYALCPNLHSYIHTLMTYSKFSGFFVWKSLALSCRPMLWQFDDDDSQSSKNNNKNRQASSQSNYLLVLDFNKNLETAFPDSIFITHQTFFYSLQHKKKVSVIYFYTSKQEDFARRLNIFLIKVIQLVTISLSYLKWVN